MQKGFFTELAGLIDNYDIKFAVIKSANKEGAEELTVLVTPTVKVAKKDQEPENMPPFTVSGTPEELDEEFFKLSINALQGIDDAIGSVEDYNKSFDKWLGSWNGRHGTEQEKLRYQYELLTEKQAAKSWNVDKLKEKIKEAEEKKAEAEAKKVEELLAEEDNNGHGEDKNQKTIMDAIEEQEAQAENASKEEQSEEKPDVAQETEQPEEKESPQTKTVFEEGQKVVEEESKEETSPFNMDDEEKNDDSKAEDENHDW